MKKRIVSLVLAFAMFATVFAGCKKSESNNNEQKAQETVSTEADATVDVSSIDYPKNPNYPHVEELINGEDVDTTYDNSQVLYQLLVDLAEYEAEPDKYNAIPGIFKETDDMDAFVTSLEDAGILDLWKQMTVTVFDHDQYVLLFTEFEKQFNSKIYAVRKDQKILMSDGSVWDISATTEDERSFMSLFPSGAIVINGVDMSADLYSKYGFTPAGGVEGKDILMNYFFAYFYNDGKVTTQFRKEDEVIIVEPTEEENE